jgi:hypothetical protein
MLSEKELRVLASFFPSLQPKTSKEIELSTKISHEPAFRVLEALVKKGYLLRRKIGNTNLFHYNHSDESYLIYAFYAAMRQHEFKRGNLMVHSALKELLREHRVHCAALNEGNIIVVSDNAHTIGQKLKSKGLNLRPVVLSYEEFQQHKAKPDFLKSFSHALPLDGIEFMFKELYASRSGIEQMRWIV